MVRFSHLVLLLAAGCSYSPPIRGLHAGMPGRITRGQLEVGGEAGGLGFLTGTPPAPPTAGGPHVAYGLRDDLVLEGGANLDFIMGRWATAYGGVRLSRSKPLPDELVLVGDLEFGAGLGLEWRNSQANVPPQTWQSYGLYEGFGVGVRWRFLGAYLRGRLDASASTGPPSTLWPSALLGVEARAGQHVVFGVGAGLGALWNQNHGLIGFWFYQAQIAFLFDLAPAR